MRLSLLQADPATTPTIPPSDDKRSRSLLAIGVAVVLVLTLVLYGLGAFNPPAPTTSSTTTATSTTYNVLAGSVISSAANNVPAGYLEGSSKQLTPHESGLVSAGYALYSNQGGGLVNMTVIVFNSTDSAQRYGNSVINNAKDLGGYSDVTSTLSHFDNYGPCYGYAESDPEGGGYVANGVCVDGNVYIYVHLVSTDSLYSAEDDMSSFVGAAYMSLG